MRREPLDRDVVEGVVVQDADPGAAKPEDRFLEGGREVAELGENAEAVDEEGAQRGGEEASNDDGDEAGEGLSWRGVGDETDVKEEHGEDGAKEDEGGVGADGEGDGEDHGDGEEGPAQVRGAFEGEAGDEGVGFREDGIKGETADSVAGGGDEVWLLARELHHATAALAIRDHAGVDGRLAEERITAVDGFRGGSIVHGTPDDQGLVIDFLVTDRVGIEHHDARAVRGTSECKRCVVKRTAAVAVEFASVSR